MKRKLGILGLIAGILIGLTRLLAQQMDPSEIKKEAEKYYNEGSFARALELYKQLDQAKLPPQEARWLSFRLADTVWRSEASTESPDNTNLEKARQQLEALVRDIRREEERDQIWAEVQESLGDSYWEPVSSRNWSQAFPYYQNALDWWAGSDQIELARKRYLRIVWKMDQPPRVEPYYYYGNYGNYVPLQILENALNISVNDTDRARVHYLIAMTLRYQGGDMSPRVAREFEEALKAGKSTDWHDDALFHYAQWLSQTGRMVRNQDGSWRNEPDFKRALELYRQLITQYTKGETRYYDQAKNEIENITRPVLSVSVANLFLPGSEIQYYLSWRNVKRIDLSLYPVDLTRDVILKDGSDANWIQQIQLREPMKSWIKDTGDTGNYIPGQEAMHLEDALKPGSYLLVARSGSIQARDILLVTDAALAVKTAGRKVLVYFCDVRTGAPVEGARIKLWEKYYSDSQYRWRSQDAVTGQDGLAKIEFTGSERGNELLVTGVKDSRTAFSSGYNSYNDNNKGWKIYAFTDRPAYRPGEEVQWKIIARVLESSGYRNPSGTKLEIEVQDPRGTKIKEQTITLNDFGSAWGAIPVTEAMPLGEYHVTFYDEGKHNSIGSASLFRLEEYKLPEFQVTIQTPEENGKKKAFRLGETVDVNIQADYYFGGPVANASVEVLVYQNPFYHWWFPERDYPWFYEDMRPQRMWYGEGQIIKRETLKTDALGKAVLKIETPYGQQQDLEYRVEARVTDSSRREIIASDIVRVTRQRYFVHENPEHSLYRPQDTVTVNIKTLDANDQPVQAEGSVKVTRDYWYEIWIDPEGREIKGKELDEVRSRITVFPPPPPVPDKPWRLKFRGYQHDDILTRVVKTDAKGEAELSFKPEREGYYRIAWTSEDTGPGLLPVTITAETTVWVATNTTTELGYRHGGLEIIVDKDTFRTGQKAPVMINAPFGGSYVLFSVEGNDLYSYQLIHLTGTVKLIELPIEEKYVPNIFLSGLMVNERQIYQDIKQVVVPPVKNFLKVDVKADREQYQPREEGILTVTTKDSDGNPVAAEVALGLADESVSYIQQDYAGDPRQFFFGEKRSQRVQTFSTFQQKSFVDLKERDLYKDENMRGAVGGFGREFAQSRSELVADAAAEMPASPAVSGKMIAENKVAGMKAKKSAVPEEMEQAVEVRTDFRSTAFWQPDIVTSKDGTALVRVKYPDSLTAWKATARVAGTANQFGIGTAKTRTRKPLIVRLQAPRFFVAGDKVTISAVINNNTDKTMSVTASLDASGLNASEAGLKPSTVNVDANSEKRVDWNLEAREQSTARLRVTARGGEFSDAMEKTYPVFEHGIEKLIVKSGKVRAQDATIQINIPAERKKDTTTLSVQITPSMAVTMLDALPYLIDYPYGCTEQTMSRFLPAVVVAKTLSDLGIKKSTIGNQSYGGIVEEHLKKTHPEGKKDLRKLSEMVQAGLERLYGFQHSDGGWGWWKEGESDHFMTGYVVWGFTLARAAGVEVREDSLSRGAEFLEKELVEEEDSYDMQSWMLHALSSYRAQKKAAAGSFERKAIDNLWKSRDHLNAYTRALFALSAHQYGDTEKVNVLIRNLENGVKRDNAPDTSILLKGEESGQNVMGTAHWGEDGIYWRWSDGGVEATAFALRALLAIDPQNALIEPVSNWLIKNRRGAQWSNTRDTAIVLYTMTDYLKVSQELKTDLEFELLVNGSSVATQRVTPASILSAPSLFRIKTNLIRDGVNEIQIRKKTGSGPLYFAAEAKFFSLEEPITAAGNEIFVKREYFRMSGKPTLLKGYVYDRLPLQDGGVVKSGERVEVVVTVEAKNNYEYLVFEDLKPAGLEAVEVRSGESLFANELKSSAVERKAGRKAAQSKIAPPPVDSEDHTGRTRWVYQELRDRKVAMFIDHLPQGVWEIRYTLRAEVPGQFHALPLLGHAMYVPEIRANGDEIRIRVSDVD